MRAACIAARYDAKQRGVRMGTRQDEARQLCPGIVFRAVKHDVCVRYHHAILRAVETVDFMTAHWAHLPYDFLDRVSRRIINEVTGISRVVYDISGKPPSTIEWE